MPQSYFLLLCVPQFTLFTWFFFICPVLVLHVYENRKVINDAAFDPSDLFAYDLHVFMSATKFSENYKEKKNTCNHDKIIQFFG